MTVRLNLFAPLAPSPQYHATGLRLAVNGDSFDFPVPDEVAKALLLYIVQPDHLERDLSELDGGYYTMRLMPDWLAGDCDADAATYCVLELSHEVGLPAGRLHFETTYCYFAVSPGLANKLLHNAMTGDLASHDLKHWALQYGSVLFHCGGFQIMYARYEPPRRLLRRISEEQPPRIKGYRLRKCPSKPAVSVTDKPQSQSTRRSLKDFLSTQSKAPPTPKPTN